VGVGVLAFGSVLVVWRFLMPSGQPAVSATHQRIAMQAKDQARIYSEDARIRGHDRGFLAEDEAEIEHRRTDIE
jgi:hypothetical protein